LRSLKLGLDKLNQHVPQTAALVGGQDRHQHNIC
jgi:hypothetical protein